MPDTMSITFNFSMTYRGEREVFSQKYHMTGDEPSTGTAWNDLAIAWWDAMRPATPAGVKLAGYLCYEAGNENAVHIRDLLEEGSAEPAGTLVPSANQQNPPGDSACWVRWPTPDRTSRGKRIYLRKYFHEVPFSDDTPDPAWRTAVELFGNKIRTGGAGVGGKHLCGPQGAEAGPPHAGTWVTTRTLKRRGRRPSS